MRRDSSTSVRETVEEECGAIFDDSNEIDSSALVQALGLAATIVVDEMKKVLKAATQVESPAEWQMYSSLEESHQPNNIYYSQIIPRPGFSNKTLNFCMYPIPGYSTEHLCVRVSDRKRVLPLCVSFPRVKFEDIICSDTYSDDDHEINDLIGRKVLFTRNEQGKTILKPELWVWMLLAGRRDEKVVLCHPQQSLSAQIRVLPNQMLLVCEESVSAGKRMLRNMKMASMTDVNKFEATYGKISEELFKSREGKSFLERVRKIKKDDEERDAEP